MRESADRRNVSGLVRDLAILEALGTPDAARAGGLGVVNVARAVGRDKSAVSRALATLADARLVERNEDLTYRLGPALFELAARTAPAALTTRARPHLRRLTQVTRETTHLCVLSGGNVLTVMSELSPHEFRTTGWEGITTAAWRTPSGRVLLSDRDDDALAEWYRQHGNDRAIVASSTFSRSEFAVLEEPDDDKVVVRDLASLQQEIRRIRDTGYALLDEELERQVVGASAPVLDFTGRIVAAINVSAPKPRIGDRLEALGEIVARAAHTLSVQLGAER